MKTEFTRKENCEGELIVTVDGEIWKKAQEKAFNRICKNFEAPGFRKGQAPKALVAKQVNQQAVLYEAVDNVAVDALYDGLAEHGLNLIARPTLDIQAVTADECTLKFLVTVAPEVKLGEYKGFTIEKEAAIVKDEDIQQRLTQMQNRYAELVLKEDGTVENGDTAIIDFEGFKDGLPFDGGQAENYSLDIGSGSFIPGFEEQLIGMKPEEEKEITCTFPEDYGVEDLNGAEVIFKVKVHDIKQRQLPELDDDFAKEVDIEGVETFEQLKDNIVEELTKLAEQEAEEKAENDLLTKVVEGSEVEVPEIMIDSETEDMFADFTARLEQQGMNLELYTTFTGQDEAAIKEQLRTDALSRVKLRLVLAQIAKEENLEATAEEIEAEYQRVAETYQVTVDEVKRVQDEASIKYDVTIRKAYDLIKEAIK